MKVIIVGGVAGGATAAARIRRLNEHAEITVFERKKISFFQHLLIIRDLCYLCIDKKNRNYEKYPYCT